MPSSAKNSVWRGTNNSSEATTHGLPCVVYDKNCVGSKSYFKLAEEFLKKNQIESAA